MNARAKALQEYLRCYLSRSDRDRQRGRVSEELRRATLALQACAGECPVVIRADGWRATVYPSGVVELERER